MREQKITVPGAGGASGFTATQTYGYDDLNRLTVAEETIGGSTTWKQTFEIDRYGNRKFDASNTTTLGSCAQAICNPTISTATNRISQSGYTFDANGNLTQDAEGRQFVYDAENHQKEVKDSQNNTVGQYLYDGDGKRVKKISATETTIFVYNAGGTLVAEYSTELAETQQVSYLTQDHLGSPRVITNENGAVVSRRDFTAFGEESVTAQRTAGLGYEEPEIRKNYTGYEKDTESGLEFAQARYYNPTHGRFTSVDPLTASASIRDPQTFNRYSYVLNSPYKFTDPLGLLSVNTAACGACGREDLQVDGSAFRGRDASLDWTTMVAGPPEPPPPPRPPTADEQQAISSLNRMIEAETSRTYNRNDREIESMRSVSELGQALTRARDEIQSMISSLKPGEISVPLQAAVNAINSIGSTNFSNGATFSGPGGDYTGNKCNVFVGTAINSANGFNAGTSKGYPLTDGKYPSANYLGDSRDPHSLKNLPVVRDGSLKIGDVIAYRHDNPGPVGNNGHAAIYIGGGAVVYAGSSGSGVPKANTLKALGHGMQRTERSSPHVVRRFSPR